jgi:bifunctional non-homologous end joining protein LigD
MSATNDRENPSPRGTPAGWVEPELATLTHDRFSSPDWLYERKFDGERCLAIRRRGRVSLLTRNRQQAGGTYPELAEALAAQDVGDFLVDGEVVAFAGRATSFAKLQRRLGVRNPGQELRRAVPVYFYLFDVLRADGTDVRHLPLRERKRILRRLLSYRGPLRYTAHRNTDGEAYWAHACRSHWEGVIAKRADAPYQSGRTGDWLKFKCENSQEFVIGGFTDPQGTRSGLGALLLGYYDGDGRLTYAGKVGTGFDEAALTSLRRTLGGMERDRPAFARGAPPRSSVHWVEPKLVGQVAFTEWTGAGQLRHPRYLGLRRDKDPGSVTREVARS